MVGTKALHVVLKIINLVHRGVSVSSSVKLLVELVLEPVLVNEA